VRRVRRALLATVVLLSLVPPFPAAAELPRPQRPPGQAASTVHRVLDRPEYQRPGPSLLERGRRWLADRFGRFLSQLTLGGVGSWALVLALLGVLVLLVVRFSRGLTPDPARRLTYSVIAGRSAAEWRAEAQARERAGEWRLALRCRYRALLADLAGRGLVEEVPGRTAGEYRVEVGGRVPAAATDFAGATELFERAWYGNRPTGEDEATRFRHLEDQVLAEAGR
jgi:uncharacterized protein DUF4129